MSRQNVALSSGFLQFEEGFLVTLHKHTFAGNAQAAASGTATACPHAAQWQRRYCWEACVAQRGTQLSMGHPHMMPMGVVDAGGCTTLWGSSNGPLRSTQ